MPAFLNQYYGHVLGLVGGIGIFWGATIYQSAPVGQATTSNPSYRLLSTDDYFQMLRYSATRALDGNSQGLLAFTLDKICADIDKSTGQATSRVADAILKGNDKIKGASLFVLALKKSAADPFVESAASTKFGTKPDAFYWDLSRTCAERNMLDTKYMLTNSADFAEAMNLNGNNTKFIAFSK